MLDIDESINAANAILITIENVFNENSVDLPGRKYITVGPLGSVAYDCAQLTVSWQENYNGLPGNPQAGMTNRNCATMHVGVFVVELVRDIPFSQKADIPPEPDLITESANGLMRDAALLQEAGEIVAEESLLQGGTISISAGDPAGTLQSIVMTISMII